MNHSYDVIIIGAGIIGLSTAYRLKQQMPELKIAILEKENAIAMHQSGRNSGVIHSGIYYKPGSSKAVNCIKGYGQLLEFCDNYEIKYQIKGKLIIAVNESQISALNELYKRGIENNLRGIKLLSCNDIKNYEPNAAGVKAIYVPQTGVIDFKNVCGKLYELLKDVSLFTDALVTNIRSENGIANVQFANKKFSAKCVVICAGLYSDILTRKLISSLNVRIIPFRGEYYKLSEHQSHLVSSMIYPVPDPLFPFLGVHLTKDIYGNIHAGPNAVLALKREGYNKLDFSLQDLMSILSWKGFRKIAVKYWKKGLYEQFRSVSKNSFVKTLKQLVPSVSQKDLSPYKSGIRAQACDIYGNLIDDFVFEETENLVSVLNAPSPAATACLSIGNEISSRVIKKL